MTAGLPGLWTVPAPLAPRSHAGADPHVHTTHSDGLCSPCEVVIAAAVAEMAALAITDHDTVSALPIARPEAARLGLELVAGAELTCELPGLRAQAAVGCLPGHRPDSGCRWRRWARPPAFRSASGNPRSTRCRGPRCHRGRWAGTLEPPGPPVSHLGGRVWPRTDRRQRLSRPRPPRSLGQLDYYPSGRPGASASVPAGEAIFGQLGGIVRILGRLSIVWMTNMAQRRGTRNTAPNPPFARGGKD